MNVGRALSPAGAALVSFLLAATPPAPAAAEPSLWRRSDDPNLVRVERALRRVSRFVDWVAESDTDPDMRHDFWLGALVTAEQSGARAFEDPRLKLLVAQILLGAELGREAEAAELGRGVLAQAPEPWLEAEARLVLVLAAREPDAAISEVGHALPLIWDSRTRSELFRRRADARMAQGDVRGSLLDYRAALRADDSASSSALARFGIGLALERSGNLPEAFSELRLARLSAPRVFGVELGVLTLPGVFAFRSQDVNYAAALTEQSLAVSSNEPEVALSACERASQAWREYVSEAKPDDPWLERAQRHASDLAARCEQRLPR
jgi:tetratricopeptide (TPR) repeat protein